jgi:hypothetical protein
MFALFSYITIVVCVVFSCYCCCCLRCLLMLLLLLFVLSFHIVVLFRLISRIVIVVCCLHYIFVLMLPLLFVMFSQGFVVTLLGLSLLPLSRCLLHYYFCTTTHFTSLVLLCYFSRIVDPLTLFFSHCPSSRVALFALSFLSHYSFCTTIFLTLFFLHYCSFHIALLTLTFLLHFKSLFSRCSFHIITPLAFQVLVGSTSIVFSCYHCYFSRVVAILFCLVSMVLPLPLPCASWSFDTNLSNRSEFFSIFSKFF